MSKLPVQFTSVALSLAVSVLQAQAELPDTFQSELIMDICPEYRYGNVTLELTYSIGEDPTQRPADIIESSIDKESNYARFLLRFPATYTTLPMKVQAVCHHPSRGTSAASNALSISNCDNLALYDSDGDGIPNNLEDTNCDNFFSPGDLSNPFNVDTDGDGVRDLVEILQGFDPTNPGSSPRPFVYSSAPFDPDGDGNSEPYVWRGSTGTWFIRDFINPGNHLAFPFGLQDDIPFSYTPAGLTSNVGVIRISGTQYIWLFRGAGFMHQDGSRVTELPFGIFGDNIILGPWEHPGITNPAVARLFNNSWSFYIYLSTGEVRIAHWGGNGDIPKVQDYDGDGLFDLAVFRPSTQETYIIRSSDGLPEIRKFGTGTADHTVRGDYTGDGIDDISFWEPLTGMFTVMKSDNGFNEALAAENDPDFYEELQLGLYNIHLPLNWNFQDGKMLFTVVDHATGTRFTRPDNDADADPVPLQWGLPGDHQG